METETTLDLSTLAALDFEPGCEHPNHDAPGTEPSQGPDAHGGPAKFFIRSLCPRCGDTREGLRCAPKVALVFANGYGCGICHAHVPVRGNSRYFNATPLDTP